MGACVSTKKGHKHRISLAETVETELSGKSVRSKHHANLQDLTPSSDKLNKKIKRIMLTTGKREPTICSLLLEGAIVTDPPKSGFDIAMLVDALTRHTVLSELSEDALELVISSMRFFKVQSGITVISPDHPATHFFVISNGELRLTPLSGPQQILGPGDCFGELALLYSMKGNLTVETQSDTGMWGLDQGKFREAVTTVSIQNYQLNRALLDSVLLFDSLSSVQKESLLSILTLSSYLPGAIILREKEIGDLLYIIRDGVVSCSVDGIEVRKLGKGELFGELSMYAGGSRTATVTAIDSVKVLVTDHSQFISIFNHSLPLLLHRNSLRIAFDRDRLLSHLTTQQKESLLSLFTQFHIEADTQIPSKTGIWVVLNGRVSSGGAEVAAFGTIYTTVEAETTSWKAGKEGCGMAFASLECVETELGGSLAEAVEVNEKMEGLRRVEILKGVGMSRLNRVRKAMKEKEFEDGTTIIKQGDPGSSFFLIKSGQVSIYRDSVLLRRIGKLDYFGERSILFSELRTASVVAEGRVVCWELERKEFERVTDREIRNVLVTRIDMQDADVSIPDLKPVKLLGKGTTGHVVLALDPVSRRLFALKSVSRAKIACYGLAASLRREREILLQLNHCMIMKLVKTWKDKRRVYFAMEFVEGMDLFEAMHTLGLFKDSDSQFYIGCLLLILEHLHDRGIVYRDLKPENILLDSSVILIQGYPKLIDFGTAKEMTTDRTFTIVGTPHYTAPEILTGKGYGLSVDYWSLGILLYEFVYGVVPFGEGEFDPYQVYDKVVHGKLLFPHCASESTSNLIDSLLARNYAQRAKGGIAGIKNSRFFYRFDWVRDMQETIGLKLAKAPFVPAIKDLGEKVGNALRGKGTIREFFKSLEKKDSLITTEIRRQEEGWDMEF